MTGKRSPAISVVVGAALVLYPFASALSASAESGRGGAPIQNRSPAAEGVRVKAGDVVGTLLDTSGRPRPKVAITVLAGDGTTVAEAVTGSDGTFALPAVASGTYRLKVGQLPPVAVEAVREGANARLLVVVPAPEAYSAGALTTLQWTWVAVGTVLVGAAISLPIALSGGSSDGGTASASTPTPTKRVRRLSP